MVTTSRPMVTTWSPMVTTVHSMVTTGYPMVTHGTQGRLQVQEVLKRNRFRKL